MPAKPPNTERAKAAGRANLAKGRARKKQIREENLGRQTGPERWAALLDGTLQVRDLDDAEIERMTVRSADGTFAGGRRRLPSHIAVQFQQEAIKRANQRIQQFAPEAAALLLKIGSDPDVREGDRVRALTYLIDRGLGKTPDVIRVEGESSFDQMLAEVGLDRSLADDAREPK